MDSPPRSKAETPPVLQYRGRFCAYGSVLTGFEELFIKPLADVVSDYTCCDGQCEIKNKREHGFNHLPPAEGRAAQQVQDNIKTPDFQIFSKNLEKSERNLRFMYYREWNCECTTQNCAIYQCGGRADKLDYSTPRNILRWFITCCISQNILPEKGKEK